MSLYLKFHNEFDCFVFEDFSNEKIEIQLPVSAEELVSFFQATLTSNKFVIIAKNQNSLSHLKISDLRTNHFKIIASEYLFLNFSLKKQIEKIVEKNISFSSYQDVESYLQQKLSEIF